MVSRLPPLLWLLVAGAFVASGGCVEPPNNDTNSTTQQGLVPDADGYATNDGSGPDADVVPDAVVPSIDGIPLPPSIAHLPIATNATKHSWPNGGRMGEYPVLEGASDCRPMDENHKNQPRSRAATAKPWRDQRYNEEEVSKRRETHKRLWELHGAASTPVSRAPAIAEGRPASPGELANLPPPRPLDQASRQRLTTYRRWLQANPRATAQARAQAKVAFLNGGQP